MADTVRGYDADGCEDTRATRNNPDSPGVQYQELEVALRGKRLMG